MASGTTRERSHREGKLPENQRSRVFIRLNEFKILQYSIKKVYIDDNVIFFFFIGRKFDTTDPVKVHPVKVHPKPKFSKDIIHPRQTFSLEPTVVDGFSTVVTYDSPTGTITLPRLTDVHSPVPPKPRVVVLEATSMTATAVPDAMDLVSPTMNPMEGSIPSPYTTLTYHKTAIPEPMKTLPQAAKPVISTVLEKPLPRATSPVISIQF